MLTAHMGHAELEFWKSAIWKMKNSEFSPSLPGENIMLSLNYLIFIIFFFRLSLEWGSWFFFCAMQMVRSHNACRSVYCLWNHINIIYSTRRADRLQKNMTWSTTDFLPESTFSRWQMFCIEYCFFDRLLGWLHSGGSPARGDTATAIGQIPVNRNPGGRRLVSALPVPFVTPVRFSSTQ